MDGVIYGIGNAAESKNLIMPIYDGEIRRNILNAGRRQTSAVILNALSKFEISVTETRLTLSAGIAMMNNMVGVLPTAAQFELVDINDVMLLRIDIIFTVGSNADELSYFKILPIYEDPESGDIVYDTSLCTTDGFETAGFWRETIVWWNPDDADYYINLQYLNKPYQSYHSNYASIVTDTIHPGVVATTQPADDNSRRVATTEYVKNQINKDIGYMAATITPLAGNIVLCRKSRYVQAYGTYNTTSTELSASPGINLFLLPSEFASERSVYITFFIQSQSNSGQTHCRVYLLNGTTATYYSSAGTLPSGAVTVRYSLGYTTGS